MKGRRLFGHWVGGVLMAVVMCGFLPTEAKAASYSDVEGHWAQPAIERWSESGILKGYEDGRFGPNDPMTRAELATVLYRLWGCQPREGLPYEDLDPNAWYYDALTTMEHYEIALGRGDHIYPNERLTREEAFYMVGRALGFADKQEDIPRAIDNISDWEDIGAPYSKCIRDMFSEGALKGSDDGKFHPGDPVTRAQIITVIDNIFDVCISEPGEYTLQCSQVALVLCGDVKITYTGKGVSKRGISGYYITAYLMDGVGPRGVTMVRDPELGTKQLRVEVRGVKSVEPDQNATNNPWTCIGYDPYFTVGDQRGGMLSLERAASNCHMLFAGGIGTKTYPYRIQTEEQFLNLADLPSFSAYSGGSRVNYVELCRDITLSPDRLLVGDVSNVSLDGKGHTVTFSLEGEIANESRYVGLFESFYGDISNLNLTGKVDMTLTDAKSVRRQYDYEGKGILRVGTLAGNLKGSVTNCTVSVDTTLRYGDKWAARISFGGIAGMAEGELADCAFEGNMTVACSGNEMLTLDVGGLVGLAEENLLGCKFTGTMTVDSTSTSVNDLHIGGLVGYSYGGKEEKGRIENTVASGKITATESARRASLDIGGIAGATSIKELTKSPSVEDMLSETETTLSREDFGQGVILSGCGSTAELTVIGSNFTCAGGLVGLSTNHVEMPHDLTFEEYNLVENCWSTATITAKDMSFEGDCGGLIGHHYAGVVRSCWAKPLISVEDKDYANYHNVGAVVGKAVGVGSVSDCWGDASGLDVKTTNGLYHYGGIMGRQDNELANCFVLGNSHLAPENAISYKAWSFADVVNCVDLTNSTAEQRKAFYESCGWDFETVWDNSGVYPILRGCDADAQREAQGL